MNTSQDTTFTYWDENSAPAAAQPWLEKAKAGYGFVPNLHKLMAGAPVTLEAYSRAFDLFVNHSSFTKLEAQVVFMTANYENSCHYCMAGHTWAMESAKMPKEVISALREGTTLPDPKLEALRSFTKTLLDERGHVGEAAIARFLSAGYSKEQALEVLCGLSAKLISNFTNALAHTELDAPMKPYAWSAR